MLIFDVVVLLVYCVAICVLAVIYHRLYVELESIRLKYNALLELVRHGYEPAGLSELRDIQSQFNDIENLV